MSQLLCNSVGGKAQASRGDEHFPDPFYDMASMSFPDTISEALFACEKICSANGPYREAIKRVISYFITDLEITGASGEEIGAEEKRKYIDFLEDTIGIKTVLAKVAEDYLVYGNSFTSLLMPFRRYLGCPRCGLEAPLKKIYNSPAFGFSWSGTSFNATCPHCQYSGKWRHIDRRSSDQDQIKVKRWSPHEIDILHDPYTDDTSYIWKIPDDYRSQIRRGHLFHLERASWEVIQAVESNQYLLFDKDVVYHMKEEALAGIRNRGWGISRVLANFRQAYYVQVLHRYNEAIALDYVIPFRVITPQPRQGQGGEVNDPVLSINMGGFVSRVNGMIAARRRDPSRWNILPFPVEYQALGGDATQLAPKELLEYGMDILLNAAGIPVDMYRGSLTAQTAMPAMRLFEANWSHLVHNLNRFLAKLVDKVSQLMSWEPVVCRLMRVTHADDLNRQMAKLQLMMGGQISQTTGLASVGLDKQEETRKKLEEQQLEAELTQQAQKKMEQSAIMDEMAAPPQQGAAPGGAPPGGAPPGGGQMPPTQPGQQMGAAGAQPMGPMGQPMGPGGAAQSFAAMQPTQPNQSVTLEELEQKAMTYAQQLMMMPASMRQSAMIQLKKSDKNLHALVRSAFEEMERDAELQGKEMMMQQMYGKQAEAESPALPVLSARDLLQHLHREPRGIVLDSF